MEAIMKPSETPGFLEESFTLESQSFFQWIHLRFACEAIPDNRGAPRVLASGLGNPRMMAFMEIQ